MSTSTTNFKKGFTEVLKRKPIYELKKDYKKVSKKYQETKDRIIKLIDWDDCDVISSYDLTELKELHSQKHKLYWDIYHLEHPNDIATKKAYDFLEELGTLESLKWLQNHNLTTHKLIVEISNNPNFLEEIMGDDVV